MLPGPESVLDKLSEAQREQVISWLERFKTSDVVTLIAKEPPEGFGLKTHVTTLRRFHARHLESQQKIELEIVKFHSQTELPENFDAAIDNLLTKWALTIATNPQRNSSTFKALSCWSHRIKEQRQRERLIEINERRLALEREKFEFNAARQALLHHERLGNILASESTDEQKINAAREQLFGEPPNHDSSVTGLNDKS